jgi:hypothetical protein
MKPSGVCRWTAAGSLAILLLVPRLAPAQSPPAGPEDGADPIRQALQAMYNQDFEGAKRMLDAHLAAHPADALGHGARATVLVFEEYERLQILDLDFFGSDDDVTGKLRVKPDPRVRAAINAETAEARRLADGVLKTNPTDRRALYAQALALGMDMQYAAIVEKRYIRTGTLSRECQALADRNLSLSPPIYDAYIVLGSIEYVVASLNPFYRFVARLFGLRADKALAVDHLQIVAAKGEYFAPFAKMLLAVVDVRDGKLGEARALMEELSREFPGSALYRKEVAKLDAKINGR